MSQGKRSEMDHSKMLYFLDKDIAKYRLSQQKEDVIQRQTQHTKTIHRQTLSQPSASTSKQAHLSFTSLQKPTLPQHFSSATQSFTRKPLMQQTTRSPLPLKHTQNIRLQHTQVRPSIPRKPVGEVKKPINQEGETSKNIMQSLK